MNAVSLMKAVSCLHDLHCRRIITVTMVTTEADLYLASSKAGLYVYSSLWLALSSLSAAPVSMLQSLRRKLAVEHMSGTKTTKRKPYCTNSPGMN